MNETPNRFDCDVAILGGGSAGYAAARTAAAAGLRTVVIENGAEVGGLCILRGCMPTKALLYAAEVLHRASHAEPWGIRAENVGFDFTKPHIYTAGDCTGPHEIVHLAVQQGEIAAHNIARPNAPRRMDYGLMLQVIFTEPQVAFTGLTEKTAIARGVPYLTARYPFSDHGKSLIMEAKDGYVKLLADPQSGEILGGACVGPVGGELIHEIVAALAKHMTVHELAALPHYHPTLAEIWTYPAEALVERIPAPL